MTLLSPARAIWASARVKVWPEPVILATFPRFAGDRVAAFAGRVSVRDANAFVAFVTEGDECTLTAPSAAFASWRSRTRATTVVSNLVAITIEASMPPEIVGVLAPAAERLAAAGIPIVPQCGFRTDHLLVPEARSLDAVKVLDQLIDEARKEM